MDINSINRKDLIDSILFIAGELGTGFRNNYLSMIKNSGITSVVDKIILDMFYYGITANSSNPEISKAYELISKYYFLLRRDGQVEFK